MKRNGTKRNETKRNAVQRNRLRAYILLVTSRASFANKRCITRLVESKEKMLRSPTGKTSQISNDWQPTSLMLNKTDMKGVEEKRKQNRLCKSKFFQEHKPQTKEDFQCPVQYLDNIGPVMGQSDWGILVTGHLNLSIVL